MSSPTPSPQSLHLVRHGEVENPQHLVYGALPGFSLSDRGRRQASAAAQYLSSGGVEVVVSSPLERAVETATPIAAAHGLDVMVDAGLTEWAYGIEWSGHPWESISDVFPGQLEAYLTDPVRLPFSPESLDQLTHRLVTVVRRHVDDRTVRSVVVVAHQDPVEALRRHLTGRSWDDFHEGKPQHGSVVTLTRSDDTWTETGIWHPAQDD